jgi:diguanylate cyclase
MRDLITNVAILVAYVSLFNQIIKSYDFTPKSSKKKRFTLGIATGLLGCLFMIFNVEILSGVMFDYRNTAIILASAFGGIISSALASILIGIFGFFWMGTTNVSAMGMVIAILMGIVSPLIISKIDQIKVRYVYTTLITIAFECARIILAAPDRILIHMLLYSLGSIIVASAGYLFIMSLIESNYLYRKYRDESVIDYLTGLNNVRQFDRIYNNLVSRLQFDGRLSLLFIDIDHFKKVNDSYGHTNGDLILGGLGNLLLKTCREFDVASRNGGEEFSVILPDCSQQEAVNIAERIRSAVEQHSFHISEGRTVKITVSIGIAIYPDTTESFNDLIMEADSALYQAKQSGRNKVILAGRSYASPNIFAPVLLDNQDTRISSST